MRRYQCTDTIVLSFVAVLTAITTRSEYFAAASTTIDPTAENLATTGESDPNTCSFLRSGGNVTGTATGVVFIGALGIKGEDALFQQWNATFSEYLTQTAGVALGGRIFQLIYLDFDSAYEAVARKCVDFVFVNPSMHACLELEYGVIPVRTLENFRNGQRLDKFYGTIFTRADRTDIQTLGDLRGKVVEAVSISGLGACQLQWRELLINGVDFLNDPKQVRFSSNQKSIVKDVISGAAEVGMVRTEMAEGMHARGEINISDIRVINLQADPGFPFPYSTTLAAPEWPLSALVHVSDDVVDAVRSALSDMTEKHEAAQTGMYAAWKPAVTYVGMYQMMSELQWIRGDKCLRNADTYESITCPVGSLKVTREVMERNCADQALESPRYACPDGYICICKPCIKLSQKEVAIFALDTSAQPETSTSAQTECLKLQPCVSVVHGGLLSMKLIDYRQSMRSNLGLLPSNDSSLHVRYRWVTTESSGEYDSSWRYAEAGGLSGHYTFAVKLDKGLGNQVLEVEVQDEAGYIQAQDSPVMVEVFQEDIAKRAPHPAVIAVIAVLALSVPILAFQYLRLRRRMKFLTDKQGAALPDLDLESPLAKIFDFIKRYKSSAPFRGPTRLEATNLWDTICRHTGSLAVPNLQQQLDGRPDLANDEMTSYTIQTVTHSFYLEDFGSSVQSMKLGMDDKEKICMSLTNNAESGLSRRTSEEGLFLTAEKNERDLISSRQPPEILPTVILKASQVVVPPRLLDVAGRDYFMDFISVDSPVRECASPLALVAKCSIETLGLGAVLDSFEAEDRWLKFAARIEAGYPERGYHCRLHAADVTNRLAALMARTGVCSAPESSLTNDSTRSINDNPTSVAARWMTAALAAAMLHDYDHPQLSNQYLVAMGYTLSKDFNDQSVGENHSLKASLALMEHPELDFIADWSTRKRQQMRSIVIQTVLATDMSKHFEILTQFQTKVANAEGLQKLTSPQKWVAMDSSQKMLTLQMAMKVSDLGACALPLTQHKLWNERLKEELFLQGDREINHGLPPSLLMDRRKPGVEDGKNQVTFFKLIVLPLFSAWVNVFPECQSLLNQARSNYKHWGSLARGEKQ